MGRRAASLCAAIALGLVVAGCGGGGGSRGGLEWDRRPQVLIPHDLPNDRILVGRVRNSSKRTLHLVAARLLVRDGAGRSLPGSSAGFTTTYAHGLFGALQQPSTLPTRELVRLGRLLDLAPGVTAPFYAAWRLRPDSRQPITVDYRAGKLTAPSSARRLGP